MKKIFIFVFITLCIFIPLFHTFYKDTNKLKVVKLNAQEIELKKEYPIKSYHEKISLKCIHCHENQSDNPENFTEVEDAQCFSCHGDLKKVADRTGYMNDFGTNPHDSHHKDGTISYYCNECHLSHEESENQCMSCHAEAPNWMKEYVE